MSVLEKAVAHFTDVINNAKTYSFEVEEWGSKVYFKPIESLRAEKINKIMAGKNREDIDGMIDILITRAINEDGSAMFKTAERDTLKKEVSPTVIASIVRRMGNEEDADIVDDAIAEKP